MEVYAEGWCGASHKTKYGDTHVFISTRLTPELKNEGIARDLIRNVQKLRKEAGLEIDDRIRLCLLTESSTLKGAIEAFADYIKKETLAVEIAGSSLGADARHVEVRIGGEPMRIELTRAG